MATKPPRKRTLLSAFYLCCLLISLTCRGAGVHIVGDLVLAERFGQPTTSPSLRNPFEITVEGEQWCMRIDCGENYYEMSGSDGVKTCTVTCFSEKSLFKSVGPTNIAKAGYPGSISDTPYPFTADSATRVVWLAFASSAFFSTTNWSNLPALWSESLQDPVANAIKISEAKFLEGPWKLPAHLVFVLSFEKLRDNPRNPPYMSSSVLPNTVKNAMEQVKKGENHQIATYEVLATTNVSGRVFPVSFELEVFDPISNQKMQAYVGTVRSIVETNRAALLPELVGLKRNTWVQDFRFSDRSRRIDNIRYPITNGIWPDVTDATLIHIFQREQKGLRPVNEGSLRALRVLFVVFVGATFPIVILFRNKRRRELKTNP